VTVTRAHKHGQSSQGHAHDLHIAPEQQHRFHHLSSVFSVQTSRCVLLLAVSGFLQTTNLKGSSLLDLASPFAMSKRARTAEAKKQPPTTEREDKDDAWVESAFASRYNTKPTPKDK